ncbi:MAG: NlpC/P60 family protein, partial [Bacteroidota bacterium]|nr:NlpC/P60 family protein [Bacteroidota bacterium]
MLRKTIILLLLFTIAACGPGKKRRTYSKTRTVTVEGSNTDTSPKPKPKKEGRKNAKANDIISTALTFSGTRYKYGGTTKKGMDCSGLVYVSLKENDIMFPRTSYQMA